MKLTKQQVKENFFKYNKLYFNGKLSTPKFLFFNAKNDYGRCIYGSRNGDKPTKIWISTNSIKNEEMLNETLIHEMIHQYIYEHMYAWKYQFVTHGLRFRYVVYKLNKKYDIKIKVHSWF